MAITHEMSLIKTHPSGFEEWYCPVCFRWTPIMFSPVFGQHILEEGDPVAQHVATKGVPGRGLGIVGVEAAEE